MEGELFTYPDPDSLAYNLAQNIADEIIDITRDNSLCKILLSGGKTPAKLYTQLTKFDLPWNLIHLFWSDERFVPFDSVDSNYFLVKNTILDVITIPEENIHPIVTDFSTKELAADNYEKVLQEFFGMSEGSFFDINILGIGEDGHVASLFPGSFALHEQVRMVLGVDRQKPPPEGITVTLPVLNNSEIIYVVATGENKAEALKRILHGNESIETCPARGIHPKSNRLEWWTDEAAGKLL